MSAATPDPPLPRTPEFEGEDEVGAPSVLDRLRSDRVVRIGMAVAGVVAVVLAVRVVADRWNDASELDLDLAVPDVAAALAAVVAANTLLSGSWGWLLRRLGTRLDWPRAMQIWWTGQLGTYLPTGLGSVPARVVLARRAGVGRGAALLSTGLEPITIVLVCGVDAALLLGGPGVALAAVGLVVVTIALVYALRLGGRRAASIPTDGLVATAAGYVALQQAQVVVRGLGLWAGLSIVAPLARPSPVEVIGVVGASYLVGFLVVFAPGGLGAREAAMTALLSGTTGATPALAAAVAWRLLEILVVLPSVAISNLTVRLRRR